MAKKVNILITIALFTILATLCHAATYYVAPKSSGVSTNQGNPGGLKDTWYDMCAGITVGNGDTIQLANGTYNDTVNDVPPYGLGYCMRNIDLTVQSESGDPKQCIIDFSGNNPNICGFFVWSTGTWKFKGLTIHGSAAMSYQGEITFINGTLLVSDCVIYNNKSRGSHGVTILSLSAAVHGTLYNCEIYDTADDGYTSKDTGGNAADRIIEAHYCYFHDINTAANTQGMTFHDGGTGKAYFCKFERCGAGYGTGIGSGHAIAGGDGCPGYVYNCTIKDCFKGISTNGPLVIKGCTIENVDGPAVLQGGTTAYDVEIEDCLIRNAAKVSGTYIIEASGGGNVSIKKCGISGEFAQFESAINTLDNGYTAATNRVGKTLTVEDCVIYAPFVRCIQTKHQTLNCRRNLMEAWEAAPSSGIVQNYFYANGDGNVTMNIEHNCIINRGGGSIISTWGSSSSGANTADVSSTIYGNTYTKYLTFFKTKDGTIAATQSDRSATMSWINYDRELMLPVSSIHYRDYGAPMMPGWWLPEGQRNMGTFTRHPIEEVGLAGDLDNDYKVDLFDFAIFAGNWLVDCDADPNNPACAPR